MKKAIVVNKSEVRKILAQYFNVPIEDVWPSKYSFTVVQDDGKELSESISAAKVVHNLCTM